MKKIMALMSIGMFVLSLGFVSAQTMISGIIYNSDYSSNIEGANVTVSCDHFGNINIRHAVSSPGGYYSVIFSETGSEACNNGDIVTVYAEKGGLTGVMTGVVDNDVVGTWDIAVVNIPLVPEFGFFIGMLTILSAIGVFFIVRKD